MADLIVSPVIDVVMQRVVAYLKDRIELHSGVEEKLKNLVAVLNRIQPVANTAEEVDLEKHKDLKPWMMDLKFAVEEAKDVVDEFEYMRLKRKVEAEVRSSACPSSGKRVSGIARSILIPSCFYNYANKIIMIPSTDLLKRLRGVQSQLEELDSRAGQLLQLVERRLATDREEHIQDVRKRETSSSVVERELVGRRNDMLEEITRKLLQQEEKHISVIAVVGHGGMGKTTLAQNIFNDTRVESHFQVRMWAHVSQVFDVWTLTKKILESATRKESSDSSLETLQQKLIDELKSKRFLLVLDDVWYSQPNRPFAMEEEWKKLCSPLSEACGKGSKILLTSRTMEVNKFPSGALMTPFYLEELAHEECWSIMQTSAFLDSGIPDNCRNKLVAIGKKIARKVQGSPLAAKAVGGILRQKLSLVHWRSILNTELSKLPGNDLMPVLRLSYQYLSPHLRQCFAYCSLFPKGHIFDVHKLVRMWVAHGYIGDRLYGDMTEEDMGKSYFDDLLSAGFFTSQEVYGRQETVMHDLMNDLAQSVTRDEILRIEEDIQYCPIPKTVRHLSVTFDYLAVISKTICNNLSHLESFFLFPRSRRATGGDSVDLVNKLVKELLQQLRRVRVLELSHCTEVEELPDNISHWVHLRYLDVSYTKICRLPDSLMILYHLQVLSKKESYSMLHLEIRSLEKLNNLVNLRYLDIDTDIFLNLTCIRGLKSLQEVKQDLHVEERRGSEMKNLKDLNDLRGALRLNNLHYIESKAAAREAKLCRKNRLQALSLQWGGECSPDLATKVLKALQPPKSLEELYIDSYPGMVCPSWMSTPVLENLASIELMNLFHLECIPPLRQQLPFLQRLELKGLPRVRKLSLEGFPSSLKVLTIGNMEELEEWSGPDGSGGLPFLESFIIFKCPNMRMLPALSYTVTRLRIMDVGISTLPGLVVDQGIITNSGSSSSGGITSFSSKLFYLEITDCGNLTSLGEGLLQNQQRLTHLECIIVRKCELLVSLPDGGFQEVKSLSRLVIVDCPNLTWAAPREDVDRGLLPSSLEELSISHIDDNALSRCLQGLSRLSKQQAYLTSLRDLCIYFCQALTPSALEEGLHALPSLKELRIEVCPGLLVETSSISAADDGEGTAIGPPCPPLALEELWVDDPQMLVNVPVLKSLTSVRKVLFSDAYRLDYVSAELEEWLLQNGTSLTHLTICNARQLQSLPKLPGSLELLRIYDADGEFKKRFERDTGCDWYKIRHIKDICLY